jgi:hypothetical protein
MPRHRSRRFDDQSVLSRRDAAERQRRSGRKNIVRGPRALHPSSVRLPRTCTEDASEPITLRHAGPRRHPIPRGKLVPGTPTCGRRLVRDETRLAHDRSGAPAAGLQPFHAVKPFELQRPPFMCDGPLVSDHRRWSATRPYDRVLLPSRPSQCDDGRVRHSQEAAQATQFLRTAPRRFITR